MTAHTSVQQSDPYHDSAKLPGRSRAAAEDGDVVAVVEAGDEAGEEPFGAAQDFAVAGEDEHDAFFGRASGGEHRIVIT